MRISDWSSDVCSSDLPLGTRVRVVAEWPCRDDHALVVVAQVIDHEGRDAFVPLAVEAGTPAAAGHPLAPEALPRAALGLELVYSPGRPGPGVHPDLFGNAYHPPCPVNPPAPGALAV